MKKNKEIFAIEESIFKVGDLVDIADGIRLGCCIFS